MSRFVLAAVTVALAFPSLAKAAEPCHGATLDTSSMPVVSRVVEKRVNFIGDGGAGCPKDAAQCRRNAYVVAGDVVVHDANARGGLVCATFKDKSGIETTGWLPQSALRREAVSRDIGGGDFAGEWSRTEATLSIVKTSGNAFRVVGVALYGSRDKARAARGGVNTGSFEATTPAVGGVLQFALNGIAYENAGPYACRVRMQRAGAFLVVEDNNRCGGANVSFKGIYRRGK